MQLIQTHTILLKHGDVKNQNCPRHHSNSKVRPLWPLQAMNSNLNLETETTFILYLYWDIVTAKMLWNAFTEPNTHNLGVKLGDVNSPNCPTRHKLKVSNLNLETPFIGTLKLLLSACANSNTHTILHDNLGDVRSLNCLRQGSKVRPLWPF